MSLAGVGRTHEGSTVTIGFAEPTQIAPAAEAQLGRLGCFASQGKLLLWMDGLRLFEQAQRLRRFSSQTLADLCLNQVGNGIDPKKGKMGPLSPAGTVRCGSTDIQSGLDRARKWLWREALAEGDLQKGYFLTTTVFDHVGHRERSRARKSSA